MKSNDYLRKLKTISKIFLLITFLNSSYSLAEGELQKTNSSLACEYSWNFPSDSSKKLTGLLKQHKSRVTVPIVEDQMSLVEKESSFPDSATKKVFNGLPKCKPNSDCGVPHGNIYMMSANLKQNGEDKSLNVNLCIFGLCSTAVDRTEPFDVELRIEEHGSNIVSVYIPNLFVIKCSVESKSSNNK